MFKQTTIFLLDSYEKKTLHSDQVLLLTSQGLIPLLSCA